MAIGKFNSDRTILYNKYKQAETEKLTNELSETIMHAQSGAEASTDGVSELENAHVRQTPRILNAILVSPNHTTGPISSFHHPAPSTPKHATNVGREAARPVHAGS